MLARLYNEADAADVKQGDRKHGHDQQQRGKQPAVQGQAQGNRRTHAFKDEHKAAIGNHHRKDRALRKMGGPAS